MVILPMVASFFSTCGASFEVVDPLRRSPSSLSSLWMASWCEWLPLCEWWRLQGFRVEDPSGARKGGPNRPPEWPGPTGPGPFRTGSVAPSLPWVLRWLCTSPLPLAWFWWCHPHVHDGGSLCLKSGLLRFNPRGCSYVALRSLPPLEVISSSPWTRIRLRKCSFELVPNQSFMSMFSCINTTLPNACT
jgi:hypothetical protein